MFNNNNVNNNINNNNVNNNNVNKNNVYNKNIKYDKDDNIKYFSKNSEYIINNKWIGDKFSFNDKRLTSSVEQIISLVKLPYDKRYKDIENIEFILPQNNKDINIIHCGELLYKYLNNKKIQLIICKDGKSDSAAIMIYYIMIKYGFTFDIAYEHLKFRRPKLSLDLNFYKQLKDYHT
jgi:hypothetical protein